ncbi:LL-diaminopimelate aminotransferase [Streptomyces sp. RB5]|uniref:LL-diaminopimelate aminotransferase n=1 Tax=Streptomyces smaragdinus TaxID=2585196 RepID=A0A7K0CNM1_9ACTN|nr:pyridoxal phosphate-dependent aminotransferase [Streptomyces smaragdinus]MQY15049.1 LL-diaminopimelate aminotransferase [Streptomyces smaragdinus]
MTRLPNLTQYERIGIERELNLADGHARQLSDSTQREITALLPALYTQCESVGQQSVEALFQDTFYRLAGQQSARTHTSTLMCYSASLATDLVAAFLAAERIRVGLLTPCFDNLAGLLRRRGADLVPVPEETVATDALGSLLLGPDAPGALFLTLPNNPTGFSLTPDAFERVVDICAVSGTLLVIDWTFRFFANHGTWDQYAVLERSGVRYLCVEDTGKTWPTLDLKCSILATSASLFGRVEELHNDLLLNVSPFVLRLLVAYLNDSLERGLESSVCHVVRLNREMLHSALDGSILVPASRGNSLSVEWLRITSPALTGIDVVALLAELGIAVLPGDHFHWDAPDIGSRFVRFALARDPEMFARACSRLRSAIDTHPQLSRRVEA